ncbi:Uncharacterized protein APZ42_013064 [Daphnia magna]|uniref:Uncharacterized protein n=1 Tax=Daphnia magna TaxID=35525 RepID=A0A162R7G9_9CRUS|nr:Uncharacterized protein APZ42_013064 [Daphnia magna]
MGVSLQCPGKDRRIGRLSGSEDGRRRSGIAVAAEEVVRSKFTRKVGVDDRNPGGAAGVVAGGSGNGETGMRRIQRRRIAKRQSLEDPELNRDRRRASALQRGAWAQDAVPEAVRGGKPGGADEKEAAHAGPREGGRHHGILHDVMNMRRIVQPDMDEEVRIDHLFRGLSPILYERHYMLDIRSCEEFLEEEGPMAVMVDGQPMNPREKVSLTVTNKNASVEGEAFVLKTDPPIVELGAIHMEASSGNETVSKSNGAEGTSIGHLVPIDQTSNLSMEVGEGRDAAGELRGRSTKPREPAAFDQCAASTLAAQDRNDLIELPLEFQDVFADSGDCLDQCTVLEHSIPTGGPAPIKQLPRRRAWRERKLIEDEVNKMLKQGRLNEVTTKDVYPLPRIEDAQVSAAPVYEPGDLVLIIRPQRKKGLAEKLLHQYVGPYKVIRQVTELNFELRKSGVKKTLVKSDSEEGDEKLERADTDVERTDTDLDVERADTGSEEARAKTEACMVCAETETGETPEADTGVTPDTNTAAAGVEPPAKREKGRMRCRPLELIAEMDEGLQEGKDSAIPSAVESPAGRPIRKKPVPGWVKNMLFFLAVYVVGQMVQANEIRGKYVATEGAVFHPEGTLALGDSEWVVIYDVPTKRDEQVIKLVATWVDYMARAFDKASTGNFPMEVTPFLEGPALDLAEIKARAERRRQDLESVQSRLESFDKKGLEVVHLLQEQATLLNVTMGHLAEHESEISALMSVAGQTRREQAQLTKFFNDSWTHLARELLFLKKVTRSVEKANRALDWTADVLHGLLTGLADAAIGRLSPLLCPPNVLVKALDSVREALPQSWRMTPALQGGNGWRAYQEAWVEASLANGNIYSVSPIPVATSKEESISHSYVEFASIPGGIARSEAVRRVQRGRSPEMRPLHGQSRKESRGTVACTVRSGPALTFLRWQRQSNHSTPVPWKKDRRNWPTASAASSGVNECRRRGSCRDAERPISTGSGIIATGDKKPHYGGSTGHPSKAYTYSPRGVELTSESGWTRRQWKEEVNAKHYPFEWMIGCLFPVPLLVYL